MKIKTIILSGLLLTTSSWSLLSNAASNVNYSAPITLSYNTKGKISGMSYGSSSKLLWQPDDSSYKISLKTSILGLYSAEQYSQGRLADAGLQPTYYRENKKKFANFDYQTKQIAFSIDNYPNVKLEPLAQDRVSAIFQLGYMLRQQPQQYAVGKQISFQVASPRRAPTWTFTITGTDSISALKRDFTTIVVEKTAASDDNQDQLKLWLAPDLAYLPVRMEFYKANGDYTKQQLTKLAN